MSGLSDIVSGMHINSIYRVIDEQLQITIPIFVQGLKENNKCVYTTHPFLKDTLINKLGKKYLDSGQLEIYDNNSVYLTDNLLDIRKMIIALKNIEKKAKYEGYRNLIVAGELPFVSEKPLNNDRIFEYEATIDEFLETSSTIAICSYAEDKYDHGFLAKITKVHHTVALYGNIYDNKYFYTCPEYLIADKSEFSTEDYKAMVDEIIGV